MTTPEAQCLMNNCRKRAPADEAFCAEHRGARTTTVPLDDWLELHRRIGEARGLLIGWSALHHSQQDRARIATAEFLERTK